VDALIMKGATAALKRRWGMAAYVISTCGLIPQIRPGRYRVTVDERLIEVEAVTVLIVNCGEVGRLYFNLGEDIFFDDGWLDVIVLRANGVVGSLAAMWELFRGSPSTDARILRTRGRNITVEADDERPVQMDGELAGTTPMTAAVMRGAIDVLVPPGVWQQSIARSARLRAASGEWVSPDPGPVHITGDLSKEMA
jgi:diacylglycerol kinase family enzyme